MHRDSDLSITPKFKKRSQFNIDVNYFCECMKAKLREGVEIFGKYQGL